MKEAIGQAILGNFLSEWSDMPFDKVLDTLYEENGNSYIVVWSAYEEWDEIFLAKHISNLFTDIMGAIDENTTKRNEDT